MKTPAERAAARREPGLFKKFTVERTNGSSAAGGKHEHCDYFVLDLVHDKFAKDALYAYAKACEDTHPALHDDLIVKCGFRCDGHFRRKGEPEAPMCGATATVTSGNGLHFCDTHAEDYAQMFKERRMPMPKRLAVHASAGAPTSREAAVRLHIAGFPVRIGTRGRQLCAWCGHHLFDIDHAHVMVAPNADGSPGDPVQPWPIGELVALEGPASWVVPHKDGDPLPISCCASPPPKLAIVNKEPTD